MGCDGRPRAGCRWLGLGRRAEGTTAQVTVTLPGRPTPYEGEVPLTRTRPNGAGCPVLVGQ